MGCDTCFFHLAVGWEAGSAVRLEEIRVLSRGLELSLLLSGLLGLLIVRLGFPGAAAEMRGVLGTVTPAGQG